MLSKANWELKQLHVLLVGPILVFLACDEHQLNLLGSGQHHVEIYRFFGREFGEFLELGTSLRERVTIARAKGKLFNSPLGLYLTCVAQGF